MQHTVPAGELFILQLAGLPKEWRIGARASHRIELKQIITQSAQKQRKILILISSSKGQQCHIAYGRILTQDILHASS